MKKYFVNPETGLLRAGWRILAFVGVFMPVTAAGMMGVRAILGSLPKTGDIQFSIIAVTSSITGYELRANPVRSFSRSSPDMQYRVVDLFWLRAGRQCPGQWLQACLDALSSITKGLFKWTIKNH